MRSPHSIDNDRLRIFSRRHRRALIHINFVRGIPTSIASTRQRRDSCNWAQLAGMNALPQGARLAKGEKASSNDFNRCSTSERSVCFRLAIWRPHVGTALANRVGAAVSRRRGVLDIFARELAPRKIYRCSIRAVRGCRRLRGFVSCEERKACWHLFRLYDAGAPFVWNSYAVPLIFVTGIGSQLAGANETLVRCGHEGSFAKGQWQPIFSADEHPAAFAGRNSRQDRRSNPTMPSRTEFMPVGSELVIATHPAAGLGMQPSHLR
jgi:hypothetical protein